MEFIKEAKIEQTLILLEQGENAIAEGFTEFGLEQPAFVQFIASENFKILKEKEYDLLIFILVVIYQSSKSDQESPILYPTIEAELIESMDEENWEVYNEEGSQNYSKALDIYFKEYPQEDLLAFVEDSLVEDEEDETITTVGREIIFITAKTLVDCMHKEG